MAQFEKNHGPIKGAGRPPGSANKVTKQMREMMRNATEENFPKFMSELKTLKGEKFVNAYLQMVKFVLPTLQSVRLDEQGARRASITEKLFYLTEKSEFGKKE